MINIQNIYYMLAYTFKILNEEGYANLMLEDFYSAEDLFAAILSKGIANQLKRGLEREYIGHERAMKFPRGKINFSSSLTSQLLRDKQLICELDEFTENSHANQILKTCVVLLLKSDTVQAERKKKLRKILPYLGTVEAISYKSIRWNAVKYHRNNIGYKMLINICYIIINSLLMSSDQGSNKFTHFFDDRQMYTLFEKFVLEYYKRHYPQLKPAASYIAWNTDDGIIEYLPNMKTDITLKFKQKSLIIDTKFYNQTIHATGYDKRTIHSNNLYQIFSYVKNKDTGNSGNVSGMLLYAKTEETVTPDFQYSLSGNNVSVRTLDLNCDFSVISDQLDGYINHWIGKDLITKKM